MSGNTPSTPENDNLDPISEGLKEIQEALGESTQAREVLSGEVAASAKPVYEEMFAILSQLENSNAPGRDVFYVDTEASNYKNSQNSIAKLTAVTAWYTHISSTVEGLKNTRGEEGNIAIGENLLAQLRGVMTPPTSAEGALDGKTETAPNEKEQVDNSKVALTALGEFLGVSSDNEAAVKASLSEKLTSDGGPQAIRDFIASLSGNSSLISSLAGKLSFSEEAIEGVFDKLTDQLLPEFTGGESLALKRELTKEEADTIADGIINFTKGLDSLSPEEAQSFELTPLAENGIGKRASDLVEGFPDIVSNGTERLTERLLAENVQQFLTNKLSEALASKDIGTLKALGQVLGFSINGENIDEILKGVEENKSEIEKRIEDLAKAVDGKTKSEIQGIAAESNRQNVDQLIDTAAGEYPEHVGTPRWNRWVNKLANGETQKTFGEYLAEDEPVEGLEALILMIKKLFTQFGGMFEQIFGKKDGEETLGEKMQADVNKAKEVIRNSHLIELGESLDLSAEEIEASKEGLAFYNKNKELFEGVPNLNIVEMDTDGDGNVSIKEKVLYLQRMTPKQREDLRTVLRSVEQRPYMKNVLETGLEGVTIEAISDFEADMGKLDRTGSISFEGEKLKINNDEVDLEAGNDEAILLVIRGYLEVAKAEVEAETVALAARLEILQRLQGKISPDITEKDIPEGMLEENKLEATFESLFSLADKFWEGSELSLEDINKIIEHRDKGTFKKGDSFEDKGTKFEVYKPWFNAYFETVKDFVNWLKDQ